MKEPVLLFTDENKRFWLIGETHPYNLLVHKEFFEDLKEKEGISPKKLAKKIINLEKRIIKKIRTRDMIIFYEGTPKLGHEKLLGLKKEDVEFLDKDEKKGWADFGKSHEEQIREYFENKGLTEDEIKKKMEEFKSSEKISPEKDFLIYILNLKELQKRRERNWFRVIRDNVKKENNNKVIIICGQNHSKSEYFKKRLEKHYGIKFKQVKC